MSTLRRQLITLIEQGAVPVENVKNALTVLKIAPNSKRWRTFFDQFLLWLGGLALAFSVLFFIAYNWKELGHFTKFGMVEVVLVIAIVAYCRFADNSLAGKVLLLAASILLGVLLALYGQVYQTGADPWQLFFNWALLMIPWAVIGRFPALWLVLLGLINTSAILYHQTFGGLFGFLFSSDSGLFWIAFIINTVAFVIWQILATIWSWLDERWAIRFLAVASGIPLTGQVLYSIFGYREATSISWIIWLCWLAAMLAFYRKIALDLFMLAGCCLSIITVTVSFLGDQVLPTGDAGSFFVLTFVVIGMGGGSAVWLKSVHRENLQ